MEFFTSPVISLTRLTAGSLWLDLPLIIKLQSQCREVFPIVQYAYTTVPTYPSGQIGFMVCCKNASQNVKEPVRSFPIEKENVCRYYNAAIHRASFILPTFAMALLG